MSKNISQKINKEKSAFSNFWNKLVGEAKEINKYSSVVKKVEELEKDFQKLTDEELKNKTFEFRNRLKGLDGKNLENKLLEILPEAFANIREASRRVLGMRHYPVQLIGGMVLNDGRIAEMKTGEGKTLVATLAVYLNALPEQNQVHLVTVNDYLARRDASWMGEVYDFLGLSVGIIQNQTSFYFKKGYQADKKSENMREMGQLETLEDGDYAANTVLDVHNIVPCDRKRAYFDEENEKIVDIVYGVNSEFGFDYLRDNMATSPDDVVQKAGHTVAIVDEVDSILIDEARTPLIISAQDSEPSHTYKLMANTVERLNPELDYTVDEKRKVVSLTDLGIEKIQRLLGIENIYSSEKNVSIIHHLDQALRARALFKKDKEYVLRDGEVVIVDENTGRLMFGRRYNQGLHQAIEAKEGLEIKSENKTVASITFQNYFRLYKKLAGMTGTAATESEELFRIYDLLVVTIPTNKPVLRNDFIDLVYKTEMGKFKALVEEIKTVNATGQPILVGTTSIEKNMLLTQLLDEAGVEYEVLNAKNHEQEARIISKAGTKHAVTIATNIAGRGVDIKLGGEKPEKEKDLAKWKKERQEILDLGGLYVIGTERHESRRIDNQLRGRGGRQGDVGKSRFFISLEDYIIRVFGGDRAGYFKMLPIADDEALENKMLSKLIEQAQKKIESQNYDMRKNVTDYDDVINKQRKVIYSKRQKVLYGTNFDWRREISQSIYNEVVRLLSLVDKRATKKKKEELANEVVLGLKSIYNHENFNTDFILKTLAKNGYSYKKAGVTIASLIDDELDRNWEMYQNYVKEALARYVFLRAIDALWTEHLVTIDHLNDSVRMRGYSQKDPLSEFKQDGMKLFQLLLLEIDREIAKTVFKVSPEYIPQGILKSSEKNAGK